MGNTVYCPCVARSRLQNTVDEEIARLYIVKEISVT